MPRVRIYYQLLAVVLLSALTIACWGDERGNFIGKYAAKPYLGPVDVRITVPPGSGAPGSDDHGSGSALFTDNGNGSARFVVVGNIREDSDAGFAVDGRYDATGWHSQVGDVRLDIDRNGTITGGGRSPPYLLRFSGGVTEMKVDLTVDLELLTASARGFPAGTKFKFDYQLSRFEPDATDRGANASASTSTRPRVSAGSAKSAGGGCKKIGYRLKPVPNLSGGSMGMVRVPKCIVR